MTKASGAADGVLAGWAAVPTCSKSTLHYSSQPHTFTAEVVVAATRPQRVGAGKIPLPFLLSSGQQNLLPPPPAPSTSPLGVERSCYAFAHSSADITILKSTDSHHLYPGVQK